MRKTVLAAFLPLALAAGGGVALAQPAAPPPQAAGGPAGWHGNHHHHRFGRMHRHRPTLFAPGTFALFHPPANRQLDPAGVREIAQAILLWNGQHDWKVTDVKPLGNDRIGFAYAAQDGTVIARFAVNGATGRIARVG